MAVGPPEQDFFCMIPCTFAGMAEGCQWHRGRLGQNNWVVEPFGLTESSDKHDLGVECDCELVPALDGRTWYKRRINVCEPTKPVELQRRQEEATRDAAILEAAMRDATQIFLEGHDIEDNDSDQEAISFLYQ